MAWDDTSRHAARYIERALWIVSSLLGPIPWVLLVTMALERSWGSPGYSVAFLAAPALWTGMALAALLTEHRRWTVVWAVTGSIVWWLIAA